jgi:hypothetical protein
MTPCPTIPITVVPAAAARVDELGLRREFEQMLDYLQRHVPGLRAIAVHLDAEVNMWDNASIVLTTHQDAPGQAVDPSRRQWRAWLAATFPGDVLRHFVRDYSYEAVDGR